MNNKNKKLFKYEEEKKAKIQWHYTTLSKEEILKRKTQEKEAYHAHDTWYHTHSVGIDVL